MRIPPQTFTCNGMKYRILHTPQLLSTYVLIDEKGERHSKPEAEVLRMYYRDKKN